jgi:hypothetical protein
MIIRYLDRVIDVTKLNSYVDKLKLEEFETYGDVDFRIEIGFSFWSFGLVPVHLDRLVKKGKYVYHLVVSNSGILICDTTKNCTNSKIQYPSSIIGLDVTQLHRTIYDYRIDYIEQLRKMVTVPLVFNYPLSKSELIKTFNSILED